MDQQLSSLLKWLKTFDLKAPHNTMDDICDGVAIAEALSEIAPEWFTPSWRAKIKKDVGTNWRLKVSNLKKIIEAIIEFYADNLNQPLSGYVRPDANKIGEKCDEDELRRLLQLVLGCAVNCINKQVYITRIMDMEESVQRAIMQSIQELEGSMFGGPRLSLGASLNVESIDVEDGGTAREKLIGELQMAVDAREQLAQRCHELDQQLSMLQEEKAGLILENKKMHERLEEFENPNETGTSLKYSGLRKQVEDLKVEVFKMETSRDDYRVKVELLEKEILDLQSRQEELQRAAEQANILKDEVDILRETADKVTKYELTIESYKKKMEDMSDLKRQIKLLEDKNMEYLRQKIELEEEAKKSSMLRSHLEACKLQLAEVHRKLDEQSSKCDKLEFGNKKLEANLAALQRERDRLIIDRDALKETNEELRCMQLNAVGSKVQNPTSEDDVENTEMIPPAVKEKLLVLQYENKMLKLNQKGEEEKTVTEILEDSEERINTVRKQNREQNQRILELESKLEEASSAKVDSTLQLKFSQLQEELRQEREEKENLNSQLEEQAGSIQVLQQKIMSLQENVSRKDVELASLDERYKKYVEKAKNVIKALDPKQNSASPTEISLLRNQNLEKRKIIEEMERALKENKLLREMEEKMMLTAFYRLSATCHKEAVDQRLAAISAGQGQSFLSRQRQPSSRRSYSTYNSK